MNHYRSMADLIRECAEKGEAIKRLTDEKKELEVKLNQTEQLLKNARSRESLPLPAVNYPPIPMPSFPTLGPGALSLSDAHLGQLLDQVRAEIHHMRNIRDDLEMLRKTRAAREGYDGGGARTPHLPTGLDTL